RGLAAGGVRALDGSRRGRLLARQPPGERACAEDACCNGPGRPHGSGGRNAGTAAVGLDRRVRQFSLAGALGVVQCATRLAFLAGLVHRTTAGQRGHVGLRSGAPGVFGGGLGGNGLRAAGTVAADRTLLVAALRRRGLGVVGDAVGILPLVDLASVHGGCGEQAGGGEDQDRKAGRRQAPAGDVVVLAIPASRAPFRKQGAVET